MTANRGEEYRPFLVTMHERWSPEQIADVIVQTAGPLVEFMVMRLARLQQLPPPRIPTGDIIPNVEPAGIGKCMRCRVADAVIYVEDPPGGGKVARYCGICAPKPKDEEEAVAETAGA